MPNLPASSPVYIAARERWYAALTYIRTMDQIRLADTYQIPGADRRHHQAIHVTDNYKRTTDTYRQTVAAGVLVA